METKPALFGTGCTYIVRPDWNVYIKIDRMEKGKHGTAGPTFFPLPSEFKNVTIKHFFGLYNTQHEGIRQFEECEKIYVINENDQFGSVESMKSFKFIPKDPQNPTTVWTPLNASCITQARFKFFIATYSITSSNGEEKKLPKFIIISGDEKKNLKFSVYSDLQDGSLSKDAQDKELKNIQLHENCQGGDYYWARQDRADDSRKTRYYVVWKEEKGRFRVHCTENLEMDTAGRDYYLPQSVAQLLPGGFTLNFKTKAEWKLIFNPEADIDPGDVDNLDKNHLISKKPEIGYNSMFAEEVFKLDGDDLPQDWTKKYKYSFVGGSHDGLFKKMLTQAIKENYKVNLDEKKPIKLMFEELPSSLKKVYLWQQCILLVQEDHTGFPITLPPIQPMGLNDDSQVVIFTPHFITTSTKDTPPNLS